LELIEKVDKKLARSLISSAALTPYGVAIWYPDDSQRADRKKAEAALVLAQKVEKAIKKKLKP
jgi:hypothetical protein